MPTWFWVDPAAYPQTGVSAELERVESTVQATPHLRLTFSGGPEDGTLECGGTGEPYVAGGESTCARTFHKAGTYRVTARIIWSVDWSRGGSVKEVLPSEEGQPTVFTLRVVEVQAAVTR